MPIGAFIPIVHERAPPAPAVHSDEPALTSNDVAVCGNVTPAASVFSRRKLIAVVAAFTVCVRREMLEFPAPGILIANEAGASPGPAGGAVITGAAV